jgi:hypothetical protein
MAENSLDRREFHKLTAAALSGLAAGGVLGCGSKPAPAPVATPPGTSGAGDSTVASTGDVHTCRGLNECKGQGKGGENACRGQGACATAKEHSCHAQNDCKGLGGCGETAGANDCKGKGECAVPLMADAWKKVRALKEAEWAEKKLDAGPAPAEAS